MKVLLVWDRAGDYHVARYKALGALIGVENTFIADLGANDKLYGWKRALAEDPNYVLLSDKPVDKPDFYARVNGLKAFVEKHGITHVGVAGYGRLEYIFFMYWCKSKGVKVVLFAESWYPSNLLVDRFKQWLVNGVTDACFVSGLLAMMHFAKRLKYPEGKLGLGYSVVDNKHFMPRQEATIPKESVLLCIARFSVEKNLLQLIEAFQSSDLPAKGWKLRLVGGGPQKGELVQKVSNDAQIELLDWVAYDELPAVYHAASAFILPSTFEPWGLVVNEAMAAGLPVLMSNACGCHYDLHATENGFLFEAGNLKSMVEALNALAALSAESLTSMGKAAQITIANLNTDSWAQTFVNLCNK